jgi:ubiquinone/menaquinone biosynthesis C-methylase UbiE
LVFEHQSVFELQAEDRSFDLTVCQHVMHSIPHPDRVIAELERVTRPGGYLHLIRRTTVCFTSSASGSTRGTFGIKSPAIMGAATGTDLFIGWHTFGLPAAMKFEQITVDYIIVDTVRVPRDTFAAILEAWRDGYAGVIGELTPISRVAAEGYFDQMIANIPNPQGYAVWMVPVVSARVSSASGATTVRFQDCCTGRVIAEGCSGP